MFYAGRKFNCAEERVIKAIKCLEAFEVYGSIAELPWTALRMMAHARHGVPALHRIIVGLTMLCRPDYMHWQS